MSRIVCKVNAFTFYGQIITSKYSKNINLNKKVVKEKQKEDRMGTEKGDTVKRLLVIVSL